MDRCVIIGGAFIGRPEEIKKYLKNKDFVIACDSGLDNASRLGVSPDLIVGDFDSHARPETDIETIVLPREKDDTDTVYAAREAMRRGFKDFLILGAVGQRLDHTLVNVYLLLKLRENGCKGMIVDDYSEMSLVLPGCACRIEDRYPYFSLIAINGRAQGVTIENAKFPLSGGVIEPSYQFATSNEVLPGRTASVTVNDGCLLLIKVRQ